MPPRPACVILAALVGCAPPPLMAPPPPARVPAPAPPTATGASAPTGGPLPAAPPARLYSADEAVSDALASPLELVGIGGW